MLNVYFTIDVEVWCDSWLDIDRKFPDAFLEGSDGTIGCVAGGQRHGAKSSALGMGGAGRGCVRSVSAQRRPEAGSAA